MRISRNLIIRLILTFLAIGLCMTVFEATKQLVKPAITIWESHTVTILFSTTVATICAYFICRRADLLFQQNMNDLVELQRMDDLLRQNDARLQTLVDSMHLEIEERKATELELRSSEARLAHTENELKDEARRKDEFLAVLAHELRNPLAPMRYAIELLRAPNQNEATARKSLETLNRQVTHLVRLIDDLLDMSRIAHGKIILQKRKLDVVESLRQLIEEHKASMATSRLSFEIILPQKPLWVDGDDTRLVQVFGNLLNNAEKFTPPGGSISVAAEQSPSRDSAVITFRDSGIGIEPEIIQHIFQPFAQADRSLDRGAGGMGLGLAISKGLIEMHGGSISVESDGIGHGSVFKIKLPLSEPASKPCSEAPMGTQIAPLRILIVEDNPDAADSLRMLLECLHHSLEVAPDGEEGLKLARSFRPDVILCDIGMPRMNGYDFARHFREDTEMPRASLVAMSGYGQAEDKKHARESGFDVHLTKPVDLGELMRVLGELSTRAHA